jgi:hypothetical protein
MRAETGIITNYEALAAETWHDVMAEGAGRPFGVMGGEGRGPLGTLRSPMTTTGFRLPREWARFIAWPVHALGVLLVPCALQACTEFADGADTALSVSGSENNPSPPLGAWECLDGELVAPPPSALGTTDVTFTIYIIDTITRLPPQGLRVAACSPLDIECAEPMTDEAIPDSDGSVRIDVPRNFDGFFTIRSEETVPAVLFIDGALQRDTQAPTMLVIAAKDLVALSQAQRFNIDMTMGTLLLRAYDCDRNEAAGVRFTSDPPGQPFAFVDGLPIVGQTVTDGQGTGGFLNVPPGLVVVQSIINEGSVVTRKASGRVRPGWFTYIDLDPSR